MLVLSSFLCKMFIGQFFKERQVLTHFSYRVSPPMQFHFQRYIGYRSTGKRRYTLCQKTLFLYGPLLGEASAGLGKLDRCISVEAAL